MKRTLIALATCLLLSTVIQAQRVSAGFKLGTSINKMDGLSFADKFTYGYNAGVFVDIKLSKHFSFQPELLFNQVNADTSNQFSALYNLNTTQLSNIRLQYLSIPLLLNYNISKAFAIQAGPQFGILLNQNKNLLQNGKDAFKSGDFSLLGGVQVKVANFRIFGRYAIGLNNLNDIDNKDKWKNQSIQVGLGFALF